MLAKPPQRTEASREVASGRHAPVASVYGSGKISEHIVNSQSTQIISKDVLLAVTTPEFVRDAVEAVRSGNFAHARMKLESGMQTHRSVVGLLALAEAYWEDPDPNTRDPKKSIDSLKDAIQLAPKDARPYALLGRYLLSKGMREQALNFLDRAIELDPEDAGSRRLRNRATLQAKKQYNVVIQGAAPLDASKPGAGQAPREEVTRLLQIDPSKAVEKLKAETAASTEREAILEALGSLFSADLLQANMEILQKSSTQRRRFGIVHFMIGMVSVATFGFVFGGVLSWFAPQEPASALQQQNAWLEEDTPESLTRVLGNRDEELTPKRKMQGVLAHVLLHVMHGADKGHLDVAIEVLRDIDDTTKMMPEALYARALLLGSSSSYEDASLDADLESQNALSTGPKSPYLHLALAARLKQNGVLSASAAALEQAVAASAAPRRAQLELAKTYAALGEDKQAHNVLARLLRQHPGYLSAHITNVTHAFYRWANDQDDAEKKRYFDTNFQVAQRLQAANDESPVQKTALALALAPIAAAIGKDEKAAALLVEAQKGDALLSYPTLLGFAAELMLLQAEDFARAQDLVSDALGTFPEEMTLVFDQARAQVATSFSDELVRQTRTNRKTELRTTQINFPFGGLLFEFGAAPLPWHSRFDPKFFPENAILAASNESTLSPQAVQRRLGVAVKLRLSEDALQTGNLSRMSDLLDEAEKDAPTDPHVHLQKARMHRKRKATEKARASLEEAVQFGSGDPSILIEAAALQMDMGRADDAQQTLSLMAEELISSPAAFLQEARLALLSDELGDAETLASKALETSPESVRLALEVISLFTQAHRPDEAFTYAQRLQARLSANEIPAARELAAPLAFLYWAMWESSKSPEIEKKIDTLRKAAPDDPWVHFADAKRHASTGNIDAAKQAFEKVIERDDGKINRLAVEEIRQLKTKTKRAKPKNRKRRSK